jgi:hypothetical protein
LHPYRTTGKITVLYSSYNNFSQFGKFKLTLSRPPPPVLNFQDHSRTGYFFYAAVQTSSYMSDWHLNVLFCLRPLCRAKCLSSY